MTNCKHTHHGKCLDTGYCNAYGCPDKNGHICEHENTTLKVISTVATCETTVIKCIDCDKYLSELKTEC
jgi:hypothetical protein